jgi:F0F1-type ATP synthase membrane subunit b/b'
MTTIKKIITYIKNYWYVPFIVVAGAVMFMLTRNSDNLFFELFKKTLEQNRKDIQDIENNNAKAKQQKQDAQEKTKKQIENIKKEYDKHKKQLEKDKQDRVEELLKNNSDPEQLAKELAKVTGWKYIPPQE